jgi:hypothetical protein
MLEKLRKYCRDNKGENSVVVVICYPMEYALKVHERTDLHHKVGQAKYLETAARTSISEIRASIRKVKPNDMPEAMLRAGLLIQRRSQELVPVDTSALKSSAFTCLQEDLDRTASQARAEAEALRVRVLAERAAKRSKK